MYVACEFSFRYGFICPGQQNSTRTTGINILVLMFNDYWKVTPIKIVTYTKIVISRIYQNRQGVISIIVYIIMYTLTPFASHEMHILVFPELTSLHLFYRLRFLNF